MAGKKKSNVLMYKERPLMKMGGAYLYGDPDDEYTLLMQVLESKEINGLKVATKLSVELVHNLPGSNGKTRTIKKVERDGLYKAMDIGEYWLAEALEEAH